MKKPKKYKNFLLCPTIPGVIGPSSRVDILSLHARNVPLLRYLDAGEQAPRATWPVSLRGNLPIRTGFIYRFFLFALSCKCRRMRVSTASWVMAGMIQMRGTLPAGLWHNSVGIFLDACAAGSRSRCYGALRWEQAEKPWFWIAMDATTCRVIACHIGDRSRERGEQREANIPMVYQR